MQFRDFESASDTAIASTMFSRTSLRLLTAHLHRTRHISTSRCLSSNPRPSSAIPPHRRHMSTPPPQVNVRFVMELASEAERIMKRINIQRALNWKLPRILRRDYGYALRVARGTARRNWELKLWSWIPCTLLSRWKSLRTHFYWWYIVTERCSHFNSGK